jgi:hypothetical protein
MRLIAKIVFQVCKQRTIDNPTALGNINKTVLRAQIS